MSQRRLPAEIYWRRRLLLLAVVILLVWIVLQVTGGEDDQEPAAAPATSSTPATTQTPTVAPQPAVKTNGVIDASLVTAKKACDPEKIRITPTVKPGQLTKGPVDIGLVVSSTQAAACTLQVDDADTLAVISANGTAIWDSTVCKSSLLSTPVVISPEWATLTTVQWTGRGSGSNCTTNEGYATPGTYTIQIGTLGGEPGKSTFTLDARPEPAAPTTAPTQTPAPPKGTTKPADE